MGVLLIRFKTEAVDQIIKDRHPVIFHEKPSYAVSAENIDRFPESLFGIALIAQVFIHCKIKHLSGILSERCLPLYMYNTVRYINKFWYDRPVRAIFCNIKGKI